ncbi:DUF3304 domain-containing protein [Xanthomonas oryzae pv. oryzae]|nr:DUF3304 domain-containing protein [Xanthomonas oryzae pv. oryzae]
MMVAFIFLLGGCRDGFSQSRTVCVTGYNEYERHIHEFWLDNESKSGMFWGILQVGLMGIRGEVVGSFSCGCNITPGKEVNLYWRFERTRSEYDAGVKPEEHTIRVKIPSPESSSSRYFRVYLRKDGTASLQWVDDMGGRRVARNVRWKRRFQVSQVRKESKDSDQKARIS